jgi:hypothetical protein
MLCISKQDLKFSWWWMISKWFCGMWCHVVCKIGRAGCFHRWRLCVRSKCWYLFTKMHDITSLKTDLSICTTLSCHLWLKYYFHVDHRPCTLIVHITVIVIIILSSPHHRTLLSKTLMWSRKQAERACQLLHADLLLGLFLYLEGRGNMFLWNVGWLSMVYMVLHPRQEGSEKHQVVQVHRSVPHFKV